MVGALIAAVLLELGKRTMGMYLQNALSISQLYGSLGLIPLFMFWVYLMWLAVLFGLQVSSTLQHLRGRQLAEMERRRAEFALVDSSVVTTVMRDIAKCFSAGRFATVEQIAKTTDLPQGIVERLVDQLVREGLVHRPADREAEVALSRPPEAIPLRELLDLAHEMAHRESDNGATDELNRRLRSAQERAVGECHLGSLLE
jgi:membrane protein